MKHNHMTRDFRENCSACNEHNRKEAYLILGKGDNQTTWPDPRDPNEVEYELRYGQVGFASKELSRENQLHAAGVLRAYRYLVNLPRRRRDEIIRQMKQAIQEQEKS